MNHFIGFRFKFFLLFLSFIFSFNNRNCFIISSTNSSSSSSTTLSTLSNDSNLLSTLDYNVLDDYHFVTATIIDDDVDDNDTTTLNPLSTKSVNGNNNRHASVSSSYYNRNSFQSASSLSSASIPYRPGRCYLNNCLNDGQCILNPNTLKSYCR